MLYTADTTIPGPTIYRLASERRYAEIPAHVRSRPQDVKWEDNYGSTALHVLCCSRQVGDPLFRAIDSILQVDASLVSHPNEATWTPLHLACEKRLLWRTNTATAEMVLRLLEACPKAVSLRLQNGYQAKTPFHIACETNAEEDVLERMLAIDPSLATQTYARQRGSGVITETPLELLWATLTRDQHMMDDFDKMRVVLEAAFTNSILPCVEQRLHTESATTGEEQTADENADTNTSTSSELSSSTTAVTQPQRQAIHIICAASAVPCPRQYLSRLLSLNEPWISRPDENRLWPLHYAIWCANPETPGYTSFLLERLLEAYPDAARKPFPASKLYPLHLLLADGRCRLTWDKAGIPPLAVASAEVLRIPDPRTRLVPALTSAMEAHRSRFHLGTTFELLRMAPEILQDGFFLAGEEVG